ncbi:MAG: nucleoside triphosphate pyrophosphohydrolase [Rikenellaceae bacterium]
MSNRTEATERILKIMDELRERCPWDREQTFLSLRNNTIEECYELVDAITSGDMDSIKEELGDLLLHVIFYSKIASEHEAFDFSDVANALSDKLIYRHPHIYSDVMAETPDEVKRNWEELKLRKKSRRKGVLGGVPSAMPALPKAIRIGEKAAGVGFDWESREDVWAKVKEEIVEIEQEIEAKDQDALEGEFGDLLFALTNACRLYNIDAEAALERTNRKFISRFNDMEAMSERPISELTLDEMELLWQESKTKEI